jgi:phosphatidylglycerophosphate synthase
MKRYIPVALTTLRLLLGPVALLGTFFGAPRWIYLPILLIATLSDICDGILARRYGVATVALRRFDSSADLIFYLFILVAAWMLCHDVLQKTWWAIAAVLATEGLLILVSFLRFRKYPAAHTYLAKFFGLVLLYCLIALLSFGAGPWAVYVIGAVGVATNSEIIFMNLVAETAPVDVRSLSALLRCQRQEKEKRAVLKTTH